MYTVTNGPCTRLNSTNAVLKAFLLAYNNHQDLVLSPDDMWFIVCLQYAKYVNDHAEQLRSLFVEHSEGKKVLCVMELAFLSDENDWSYFFGAIKREMGKNVKGEISEILTANFTTTGEVESLLSAACIMHTFRHYFDFQRMRCICGIRQVHFMGTLDDWKLLRIKTGKLKTYCISGNGKDDFGAYIDGILPIFDQFIET
ncbi:unnamed protein product, partial [Rotaria sordida]